MLCIVKVILHFCKNTFHIIIYKKRSLGKFSYFSNYIRPRSIQIKSFEVFNLNKIYKKSDKFKSKAQMYSKNAHYQPPPFIQI